MSNPIKRDNPFRGAAAGALEAEKAAARAQIAQPCVQVELTREPWPPVNHSAHLYPDANDFAILDPDGHAVRSTPAPTACQAPISPLPDDSQARKDIPLWEGVMAYFPAALIAAAKVSHLGNLKHNPGEELHHARGKSMDHTDCIARHLIDYQALKRAITAEGPRMTSCEESDVMAEHLGNLAWRVLAYVQTELEGMGRAPLPPRARVVQKGGAK